MSTEQKEANLVKTGPTAMERFSPAKGFEAMEKDDFTIPRLGIGQGLSSDVMEGTIKIGSLYNTITKETYTKDNKPYLEFAVLTLSRRRIYAHKKEGLVCMSVDGIKSIEDIVCLDACPYEGSKSIGDNVVRVESPDLPKIPAYEWSARKLPPKCAIYYNYFIMPAPFEQSTLPVAFGLGKSAIKAAQNFNTLLRMTGRDIWVNRVSITTVLKTKGENKWYAPDIRLIGAIEDEKTIQSNQAVVEWLKNSKITIHDEENLAKEEAEAGKDDLPF